MKKIFLSAALATVVFASCQNEEFVGSQESQMEEFTVEVTKGADSRVVMDNGVAKWSADDALYVYGKNGVRGTLKLTSGAGTGTATFKGVISGSKNDLTNAIFGNVTHEGDNITLTLNNVDVTQCDAPMFGAFSADKGSISLDYICGLNPVTITEEGNNTSISKTVTMSGVGVSSMKLENGEWVPAATSGTITLSNVPNGTTFYVPFFTTEEEKEMPITITVGTESFTYIAQTEAGSISETTAPELTLNESGKLEVDEESETTQPSAVVVDTPAELATAITNKEANVFLMPGEYEVDLYNIEERESLNIVGSEGTKVKFSNLQVRASQFKELTIKNCEILRMPNKSWGHLVFGSGNKADGIYTVSNCTFNGVASQGIYINEQVSGATYYITGCTFNGDFGGEGAVTIQAGDTPGPRNAAFTVNVTGCEFNNIPNTSHKIAVLFTDTAWTLHTDVATSEIYWRDKKN